MSKCKCAPDKPPSWYPARLISLEELKSQDFLDTRKLVSISKRDINTIDRTLVKLVETNEWIDGWPGHENVRYVTRTSSSLFERTQFNCPQSVIAGARILKSGLR